VPLQRYIQSTLDLCLTFDGKSAEQTLLGHVDADFWGEGGEGGGGIVAWSIASRGTLTTKAEYLASMDAH
jgi:hypothetical protein